MSHLINNSTYRTWRQIRRRCLNKSDAAYPNYGARGITLCSEWRTSFDQFLHDMGPRPDGATIERIDNSRGYEPGNCRWATRAEQNRNKRDTRFITLNGETHCVAEWSRLLGMHRTTICRRLDRGWSADRVLRTTKEGIR